MEVALKTIFKNKKISGIVGLLPQNKYYFDDEINNYNFPEKQTKRLKKIMGYETHRIVKNTSYSSDLCIYGMRYLLENKIINKEEIGAIVVVTLSPDYFLPHISDIIHGVFDFDENVIGIDISQGCCGYLLGLMQSFMLLNQINDKKVVLFNVEVLSKKVSKNDRNDYPLIGDAAAVTVLENANNCNDIFFTLKNDGKRRDALKIPAGGFRLPNNTNTGKLVDIGDGNLRALDHMHMDGTAVFNFVQEEVPKCIDDILNYSCLRKEDIDYFLFHQPNMFMLQKLREKLSIPEEKLFVDLVKKYGNSSGPTIPLVITDHLSNEMKNKMQKCCLSAFGSGLTWGGLVMDLGKMDFCDLIETDL